MKCGPEKYLGPILSRTAQASVVFEQPIDDLATPGEYDDDSETK
jgi:hypothetical protein